MKSEAISRHPEMDQEFYFEQKEWPLKTRLYVKRFPKNQPPQTGYLEKLITPAHFYLILLGNTEIRVITPRELLEEGWEVD
jgi:hypothetical protein